MTAVPFLSPEAPGSNATQLVLLSAGSYQGVLTGAAMIGGGIFAETFAPLITSGRVQYIGPEDGSLPRCRVLVMALQNIYREDQGLAGGVVVPGIYDALGFVPESELPVPIASDQFQEFWGFVSACTGYPVLWSTFENGNLRCLRKATARAEATESGLYAPTPKSIATPRQPS